MPEGPSIVILKEAVQSFKGKKVLHATGNTKIDKKLFENKIVRDFKTWGKQFFICFDNFSIRIHLLMFGSYLINETKDREPRLSLQFKNGEINFYSCAIKIIEEDLDEIYDWSSDTMSEHWDANKALKKLKAEPDMLVCDALLNQNIFSGVGNIIKNEVLFRIRVHPNSKIGKLPKAKLRSLIKETQVYCFEFFEWKKKYELKKHWLIYNKKICPRCNISVIRKHLGVTYRRSFYCENCQVLYA